MDTLRRVRPELDHAEAHILAQLAMGMMTSVTFLHLDPYRPDQVAGDGFQRLLVAVARRVLLEMLAEELTPRGASLPLKPRPPVPAGEQRPGARRSPLRGPVRPCRPLIATTTASR